jgi:hypothetical protein
MPRYFVYKITRSSTGAVSALELLDSFEAYKAARDYARGRRAEGGLEPRQEVRMIFAKDQTEAEMRLRERRERPILREWEK